MELSENDTFRTFVDSHSFHQHASPVLQHLCIRKQQSFTLADRLLSVFLLDHLISLRLSLIIYLDIGCYLCLTLELLLEHALLVLVEIELIDALYSSFIEFFMGLETLFDFTL